MKFNYAVTLKQFVSYYNYNHLLFLESNFILKLCYDLRPHLKRKKFKKSLATLSEVCFKTKHMTLFLSDVLVLPVLYTQTSQKEAACVICLVAH